MNTREATEILAVLQTAYPAFYRGQGVEDLKRAVTLWTAMFADDDPKAVGVAVRALIATTEEGYPPTIGAVKAKMYEVLHPEALTPAEAWGVVRKAIGRSAYHAAEEHEKLPEDIRRCVTPDQLRAWAVDENFNESVIMSHFVRSYRERAKATRDQALIPEAGRMIAGRAAERIGAKDGVG